MQQPEGTKQNATGTTAGTSGVTADVKAVTHSVTSQTPAKTKKASDSIYHERQGCGLFWAVGRFRPTNYMIVRHQFLRHLLHALIQSNAWRFYEDIRVTRPCIPVSQERELRQMLLHVPMLAVLCMQLCQRPLNADMKKQNHNADFIAPLFRNHLMPYR